MCIYTDFPLHYRYALNQRSVSSLKCPKYYVMCHSLSFLVKDTSSDILSLLISSLVCHGILQSINRLLYCLVAVQSILAEVVTGSLLSSLKSPRHCPGG